MNMRTPKMPPISSSGDQAAMNSMHGSESFGRRLDRFNGIGPGFDHLRVGLAILILAWHSVGASYGHEWISGVPLYVRAFLATLLPMFFGLSGFLIMGSAFRTREVKVFITFRVLRILPALVVEISLSAIVLGALVTTLPIGQYFTHPQFFEYFGSIVGAIKYFLPGVFADNPFTTVNGALWTVGPEIICYCIVAGFMVLGHFTRATSLIIFSLIYTVICVVTDRWEGPDNLFHLPPKALILSFLAGNIYYIFRYKLKYSFMSLLLVVIASIASIVVAQGNQGLRIMYYVAAFLLPYCAAFVGLAQLGRMPFFSRGDYSYGIYIYGFPIQQAIAHFFPSLRTWWFNLGLALPITIMFAVFSWHLIEKPVLGLRKKILASAQSAPAGELHDGFNVKKLVSVILIVMYALFVIRHSALFPLKNIYNSAFGDGSIEIQQKIEQF